MATSQNGGQAAVVPIVSSSAVGPLGVCHLPRMWLKVLLHAAGRLPSGYRHGTGGLDEITANNLGFDRDAFIDFVRTERPTYVETEAWVRKNATKLDPEAIRTHNVSIRRDKPPLMAEIQRTFVGLDDKNVADITLLNDLDDWHTLHSQLVKGVLPPLQLSSMNAELTEVLRELLDASQATRVAIHIDMPALALEPSKAAAEAKSTTAAAETESAKADIVRDGKPVGWIAVYGARRSGDTGATALEHAVKRAVAIIDEVSLTRSAGA
jgi:hypothetical protein